MLVELEAAKNWDQELHRMQQQTIDRLIVAQQRVDAILVQNFELHEYPIPRLFVILPDTYESWDPHNSLKERFRLFFLCECGEGCKSGTSDCTTSGQLANTVVDTPVSPIRVRNRIHLAKHEGLAALEGAVLRRLGTFLRNNDQDKILGNLCRSTTKQGHVKWVCFQHYKETYRETALVSFVQFVESAGGSYDPLLRRVTINLKSSTTAKDFFKRLATQATIVKNLDVTLSWDFGSADLVNLVDMVAKSNVRSFTLDLQDDPASNSAHAAFRPGNGRYHSLLGLLANKNLHRLQLSNLHQLGTRTSNLHSSVVPSWMQCFHFHGKVNYEGRDRLTNILSRCPNLVDLRLTGSQLLSERNKMDSSLHLQFFKLKKLQRLHVTGWLNRDWPKTSEGFVWKDGMLLQELVCNTGALEYSYVEESIRRSHNILEVLVLFDVVTDDTPID
ncbi:hypothetical protein BKA57DRAFT_498847 [Linnemannia elongata]|nr:hypothetical protein BKA57DRAFT_498847 [Linnemannia elongata]